MRSYGLIGRIFEFYVISRFGALLEFKRTHIIGKSRVSVLDHPRGGDETKFSTVDNGVVEIL